MEAQPSFSVDVLGFPRAASPDGAAAAVSKCFGIGLDEAWSVVRAAPLTVKQGVALPATQIFVQSLLDLGATVCVRNEQTGEAMTYGDGAPVSVPPAATASAGPLSTPAPVSSRASIPSSPISRPGAGPVSTRAPVSSRAPISSSPTSRPQGVPVSAAAVLASALASRQRPHAAEPKAPASPGHDPPPEPLSSPLLRPAEGVAAPRSIALCAACARPVEGSDVCMRCGWSAAGKKRVCRECKGELSVDSRVRPGLAALVACAALALVAGAAAFVFLGGLAPAGAVLLILAGFAVADASTLRYRCRRCRLDVTGEKLRKEELARLFAARSKSIGLAAALGIGAGLAVVLSSFTPPSLELASYGIGWRLPVPRTHRELRYDRRPVKLASGTTSLRTESAEPSYLGGRAYVLLGMPLSGGKAQLEEAMGAVAKAAFDAPLAASHEVTGPGKVALEAPFKGSFRGSSAGGVLRGVLFDDDAVFIAVVQPGAATVDSEDADPAFSSLVVTHPAH